MKIATSDQMRQLERRSEAAGVSTDALMENAGLAVARRIRHHVGHLTGLSVVVLVGPGNNGGDGLVTAGHLRTWGARCLAYVCGDRREPDARLAGAVAGGVAMLRVADDPDLARLRDALLSAHVVVDALLGTGPPRPIAGDLRRVLAALADARRGTLRPLLVAVDLPTGVAADTGVVDPTCVAADVTVTLGCSKLGLVVQPGAQRVGTLETVDIGIPARADDHIPLDLMTAAWAAGLLPPRPADAHKGAFGRVLMLVGSSSYRGAACLAAAGATRVGAGLVTVAMAESLVQGVAARIAEPTYLPLPESSPGVASADGAAAILEALPRCDAFLVGCGLGQAGDTAALLERVLLGGAPLPPTVIDADALNLLAALEPEPGRWRRLNPLAARGRELAHWWRRLPQVAIVTPHPGEMARLARRSAAEVQADRVGVALRASAEWHKVVVLKGANTVVASPQGRAALSPFANPGLASGGTGDVLAGAIAGLLAQGLAPVDAAALGVYLHGAAGERVREVLGEAGTVASDLLPELPKAIRALRAAARG